ncbi:hypothetical protein ACFV80_33465 [Streptomyces sp. NPDC059862]|uniref:hypothetical protein n=1 Tax=Streptomyces sp. NPDC059862 TaxID=3346975 RepID=UPI00364E633F
MPVRLVDDGAAVHHEERVRLGSGEQVLQLDSGAAELDVERVEGGGPVEQGPGGSGPRHTRRLGESSRPADVKRRIQAGSV